MWVSEYKSLTMAPHSLNSPYTSTAGTIEGVPPIRSGLDVSNVFEYVYEYEQTAVGGNTVYNVDFVNTLIAELEKYETDTTVFNPSIAWENILYNALSATAAIYYAQLHTIEVTVSVVSKTGAGNFTVTVDYSLHEHHEH